MAHGDFPDRRDMRMGGNLERANIGRPNTSVEWFGRDVPGVDRRYENYQAPHRVDYTSPRQTGTPFDDLGRERAIMNQYQRPTQPHPNPRMRHINPRGMNQNYSGTSTYPHELQHQSPSSPRHWRSNNPRTMGGGIGGLDEQAAIPNWYKWYDKLINRFGQERGSELWHQYASDDTGIGNNEYQTAYNVGDTYPLEGKPGYGTRGPFNMTPGNLPELQTIPLDQQFDLWGNPIGRDDFGYFDEEFVGLG